MITEGIFILVFAVLGPGLDYGVDAAIGNALILGLLFGIREHRNATEIRVVEALHWSWSTAGHGAVWGAAIGGGIGLLDWFAEIVSYGFADLFTTICRTILLIS